jgi:hypothetical protein
MSGSTKKPTSKTSTKVASSPKKVEEAIIEKIEDVEENVVSEIQEEVKPVEVEAPVETVQDKEDIIEEKPIKESPVENTGKANPKRCGACKKRYGSSFCGSCVLYQKL